MMIKLTCISEVCGYSYSVSETEFRENGLYYVRCLVCGSKNKVSNLEEIVEQDIYKKAEEYINKWFAELGIEGTLEMIERNKEQATYRIYVELLRKRGLIK